MMWKRDISVRCPVLNKGNRYKKKHDDEEYRATYYTHSFRSKKKKACKVIQKNKFKSFRESSSYYVNLGYHTTFPIMG